jgi:hypothetical protein
MFSNQNVEIAQLTPEQSRYKIYLDQLHQREQQKRLIQEQRELQREVEIPVQTEIYQNQKKYVLSTLEKVRVYSLTRLSICYLIMLENIIII